jgi:hypothetical protein
VTKRRSSAEARAAERFVPEGADEPLPPEPDEVVYSDPDRRRALEAWDAAVPARYAGLLDARPAS